MATYVNDLRLKEIGTGESSGTWGSETNTNLELIAEAFSYGTEASFGSDADATTTIADGASDPARSLYLKVTSGASLTATRTLTIAPNTVSKIWIIENATSGSQSISISQGSGANVTIPNGDVKVVYSDGAGSGAAVVDAFTDLNTSGTLTATNLAGTLTTAAQTNITSVGALDGGSITSGFGSINVGSSAITTTGTVTGNTLAGTLSTAAQPNITSVGTLTGLTTTGDINFGDNDKAIFGAGSDLQIYHTGTESWIKDAGTGNFYIDSNGAAIQLTANGAAENMLNAVPNGGITLYHDNAIKLNTSSTGIDVTGTATMDGLTVDGTATISSASGDTLTLKKATGAAFVFNDTTATTAAITGINGANGMDFRVGSAQTFAARIDASGNFGIGTGSPSQLLELSGATAPAIRLNDTTYNQYAEISTANAGSLILKADVGNGGTGSTYIGFEVDGANEAMRIDASSNLLVGTTNTTWNSAEGLRYFNGDALIVTRTSDAPLFLNRLSTDGEILNFNKDGTTVGSIGTNLSDLTIGTGDTGAKFVDGFDTIVPFNISTNSESDGVVSFGASANRWKDLYLSGGAYIGGTGSANYLDDYEEGTWTPVVDGTTSSPTVSYVFRDATYVKVGRWIKLFCRIRMSSSSGGSGGLKITGLPFAVSSSSDEAGGSIGLAIGFSTLPTVLQVDDGSSSILVMADQANNAITDLDWDYLYFNTDYLTST